MHDYIKGLYREASENGSPLIRTCSMSSRRTGSAGSSRISTCSGDRYLVAPILRLNQFERDVYLPAGNWRDTRDGKEYQGGQVIHAMAPIDSIRCSRG